VCIVVVLFTHLATQKLLSTHEASISLANVNTARWYFHKNKETIKLS
jgi:hypothetical protein